MSKKKDEDTSDEWKEAQERRAKANAAYEKDRDEKHVAEWEKACEDMKKAEDKKK